MALSYIKVYYDWTEATASLNDAEKGRLIDALVLYAKGDEKAAELRGNERIMFPMLRLQIDRDRTAYDEISQKRAEAGAIGGKQKLANATKRKQAQAKSSKISQDQDQDQDKDQDKDQDQDQDKDKDQGNRNNIIAQVFAALNEKTGKHFRATGQSRAHVNARLTEGYTLEDFEAVIDKKCAEWLGSDMEKYLRPETLFGSKFDGYLNEPIKRRKSGGGTSWSFEDFAAKPKEDENRVYVEPEQEGGFPF